MSSKLFKVGSLCLAGVLASIGGTAHADQINTHGAICRNFNAGEALDIDYLTNGVRDINAAGRLVICSVPRSPVAAGASAGFFVDGSNNTGTSTTCTISVFDFLGGFKGSQSVTIPPPSSFLNWDRFLSFPAGLVTTFDYVSMLCFIPGSGNGVIHGVTALP